MVLWTTARVLLGLALSVGTSVLPLDLSAQEVPALELKLNQARWERIDTGAPAERGVLPSLVLQNWLTWNNVRTNYEGGLCIKARPAIDGTSIAVYADDVRWHNNYDGPAIIDLNGDLGAAPSDWRFPALPRFAIVFYQPEADSGAPDLGSATPVRGSSKAQATVIQGVDPTRDLCFNVNDRLGTYADNGGSYDLTVRVLSTE